MAVTTLLTMLLLCSITSEVLSTTEEEVEKRIKVWEDRIQHTDLDADEVNFPLFLYDGDGVKDTNDKVIDNLHNENLTMLEDLLDFDEAAETNNNGSMFTIFHKITTNNVTKEGVTQISSSSVLPLIKTALGSISEEHMSVLALGAVLPLMMMVLPFAMMAVIVPIFLVIGITMFGVVTSAFFFMPLALFGFGLFAVTDNFFSDESSSFDEFSAFENFPSVEKIDTIGEKIEAAIEKVENIADDESPLYISNNNNVPRTFF